MSLKTQLVETVPRAGILYCCLPRWFLAGKEKQMTDQVQREPDGEALNVAGFLRLAPSLAGNHPCLGKN